MNTPKKLKRASRIKSTFDTSEGVWIGALVNPEYSVAFAEVVTDFVHLEGRMVSVLASLMDAQNLIASNYILSSLTSPTARVKMMRKLLEDSRINESKEAIYDQILSEFEDISGQRNKYVHGAWWTKTTGEALLDSTVDLEEPFLNARIVPLEELQDLAKRITKLQNFIGDHIDIRFNHGNFIKPG